MFPATNGGAFTFGMVCAGEGRCGWAVEAGEEVGSGWSSSAPVFGGAPTGADAPWAPDLWDAPDAAAQGFSVEAGPPGPVAFPAMAQQVVAPSDVFPSSMVVRLEAVFPNGVVKTGSGVMVGRNDVLTAGHVVYAAALGGHAKSIIATPAFSPERGYESPFGSSYASITAADITFDPEGDNLILYGNRGPGLVGSELDFAFLTLQFPLGDRTEWMGLDPARKEGFANLSGYPAVARGRLTNDIAWAFDDPLDAVTNLTFFEAHPGSSGGPVWYYGADGRPTVIGLVSSGSGGRGGAAFDIATSYPSIVNWIVSNDHLIA